ncbi:unnamed protein product [Dovyalis caffra]|uniref:Uncharacterized protein n=1 Tax=Dovyalis caffra TaxID=77055 RepID=A0AAV1S6U2_9ROSI|nr:unnamed protein product [Dovyalis caffra]
MEDPYLFQPLLIPKTTSTSFNTTSTSLDADYIKLCSSNSSIILRLLLIISIGIISIWANYEASKGFGITLVNEAEESAEGKRFNLLYISNDKATRIVQNTSSFVENLLYPDINNTKKQVINHVTLRLASNNLPNLVTVDANTNNEFVISISPLMLTDHTKNLDHAIKSIVLQGMARVWLWNPESRAPPWILEGMVEYINRLMGFGPVRNFGGHESLDDPFGNFRSGDKDPKVVAKFLECCETWREKGFIQRLNKALRDDHQWIDWTVEDVQGMSVQNLCDSCKNTSHGMSSW